MLYLTLFLDAAGNRFTPQEALDQFAPASRVPIYGYYDTYLGHGIVGGSFVTFDEIGPQSGSGELAYPLPAKVRKVSLIRKSAGQSQCSIGASSGAGRSANDDCRQAA